jgi:hypothetical protein
LQPGQKTLQQSIEATALLVPDLKVCGLEGCGSSAIEAINLHISSIEQPLEPQQSEHKCVVGRRRQLGIRQCSYRKRSLCNSSSRFCSYRGCRHRRPNQLGCGGRVAAGG